jgi:ribosome-binding factor A
MADAARARQLAERILVIVAEAVEMRIKDPRIGFVTFTAARMTPDLRETTIFYTVLGDEAAANDTAVALASARGVIRTEVGKRLGIKHTPSIEFVLDKLPESAAHIDELIAAAHAADAEVAAQAAHSKHAGDTDPYKQPHSDE